MAFCPHTGPYPYAAGPAGRMEARPPERGRSHSPGGAGEEPRLQLLRDRRSDCKLAGGGESIVGPRIQLWDAGIVSQSLPRRTTMEEVRHPLACGL